MKTIKKASMDALNQKRKKTKLADDYPVVEDFNNGFKAGVEFAQLWISVEDELPEIGAEIVVKLKDHPLKKYQAWKIYCKRDIEVTPIFATHWRPIELK